MSINEQDSINEKFPRNSEVFLVRNRQDTKGKPAKVVGTYDYKCAIKIKSSNGEEIVTADQLITKAEMDSNIAAAKQRKQEEKLRKQDEKKAKRLARLQPVIDLFKSGKSAPEIAKELGWKNPLTAWSRIAEARKAGML